MSFLREIQGVDVSDYETIELNQSAFEEVDIHLYPPLRTHFLIHAVQFQHEIPSESSMRRTERRNARKAVKKEDEKQKIVGHMRPRAHMSRPFRVPAKKGLPVQKHRRRRVPRNINFGLPPLSMSHPSLPPFNYSFGSIPGVSSVSVPIGMPPISIHARSSLHVPSSIPRMNLPGFIPGMIMAPPTLMSMAPPTSMSMAPLGMGSFLPPSVHLPSIPFAMHAQAVGKKIKNGKAPKELSTAFNIKSSQQIVLKAERAACKEKLENWRKEAKPNISDKFNSEIPIYFQKKKANQKRRRLQKHELIKKNRKELVKIYGDAVFRTGWPISRQEIKEALGIKEQQKEIEFEGISEMMKQYQIAEEKIEQKMISQVKVQMKEAKKENEKVKPKPEVKLVLLKPKEEESAELVPQFVYTS